MPASANGRVARTAAWKTLLFTAIVVLSNVAGNAFLSWGMKREVASTLPVPEFFRPFLSPFVWGGIALLIVWMISRMTLLSWADLSFVVPVTSLGYVLNVASGALLFSEVVDAKRWMGALLIVGGSALVGLTMKTHTPASADSGPEPGR